SMSDSSPNGRCRITGNSGSMLVSLRAIERESSTGRRGPTSGGLRVGPSTGSGRAVARFYARGESPPQGGPFDKHFGKLRTGSG
ncbi:MAG: hypothetical protein V3S20_10885, partial [Dehalococcoidia bacterium]